MAELNAAPDGRRGEVRSGPRRARAVQRGAPPARQGRRRSALALAVAAGTLVLAVSAGSVAYVQNREQFRRSVAQDLDALSELYRSELRERTDRLSLGLETLLTDPEIAERLKARDREGLRARLAGLHHRLRSERGITQFHFHTAPARSFLRLHRPESFGDDMSSFREIVVLANREGRREAGIEVTRSGPGIKVVYPVRDAAGAQVGTVELATTITTVIRDLSRTFGLSYAVGVDSEAWERASCGDLLDARVVRDGTIYYDLSDIHVRDALGLVPEGEGTRFVEAGGRSLAVSAFPLLDFRGRHVGQVVTAKDVTGWAREFRNRHLVLIAAILSLVACVIVVNRAIHRRRFSKPLVRAEALARRTERGEFDAQADVRSLRDGAPLLNTLNRLARQLESTSRLADSLEKGELAATPGQGRLSEALARVRGSMSAMVAGAEESAARLETIEARLAALSEQVSTLVVEENRISGDLEPLIVDLRLAATRRGGRAGMMHRLAGRSMGELQAYDAAVSEMADTLSRFDELVAELEELDEKATGPRGMAAEAGPGDRSLPGAEIATAARQLQQRIWQASAAARRAQLASSQLEPSIRRIVELAAQGDEDPREAIERLEELMVARRKAAHSAGSAAGRIERLVADVGAAAGSLRAVERRYPRAIA